jgi:hypothetical protein
LIATCHLAIAERDHTGIAINREHAVRRFRTEEIVTSCPTVESPSYVDFRRTLLMVTFVPLVFTGESRCITGVFVT